MAAYSLHTLLLYPCRAAWPMCVAAAVTLNKHRMVSTPTDITINTACFSTVYRQQRHIVNQMGIKDFYS